MAERRVNSPEDIAESCALLQKIHRESNMALEAENERLRGTLTEMRERHRLEMELKNKHLDELEQQLRDGVETTACTDDAPDVSDKMPEFAAKITRDAQRYHWLRKNGTHVLVGFLMREGDSLADLSPERLDAMIDRCLPENGEEAQ